MIHTVLPFIISHVVPLGALGVFLFALADESFPVIPASFVLLASSFLFLHGPFSWSLIDQLFTKIVLPATFGLTLGSLFIYTIAYLGGRPAIERFGKYITISWHDIEQLQARLEKNNWDETFIFTAWVVPIIPSGLLAIFGGVTRIPVKRYASLTFAGTFFKSIIMGLIGWGAGELILRYADVIERFQTGIGVLVVLGIIGFVYYRKSRKKVIE